MIKITQKSSSLIVAICCALMVMQVIGCAEDSDEGEVSEAPPLPPDESMAIDLSFFEEEGAMSSPAASMPHTMKNFANAVLRVAFINSAVIVATAPPAILFAAARAQEPVKQEDDSWLWSYSLEIDYVTFTAKLTCLTAGDLNYWSMKVSSNAPLHPAEDFEWYKGTTKLTNTKGTWEFFDIRTPSEQNPTAKIDWSVEVIKDEAELNIQNVDTRPDVEHAGDVLRYKATPQRRSISYDDASTGETWEIEWDETGAGSLTVPGYNNGQKAAWDSNKQDIL